MDNNSEAVLAEWVRSNEWKTIRSKMVEYCTALESVNLLDDSLPNERVGEEAKVRAKAIRLVLSWIADVEGIEERQKEPISEEKEEIFIQR